MANDWIIKSFFSFRNWNCLRQTGLKNVFLWPFISTYTMHTEQLLLRIHSNLFLINKNILSNASLRGFGLVHGDLLWKQLFLWWSRTFHSLDSNNNIWNERKFIKIEFPAYQARHVKQTENASLLVMQQKKRFCFYWIFAISHCAFF